ncbi:MULTISPECIES: DUF2231 domain-containing protein [unclassified Rathayibacter]|uniref:DUF2231 domain-containing protein n=1 Tax=unclassified Rathayibacter TaxID=2609250 RepID=UPI000CE7E59D|nr:MULTISPECIES: DUF2231 domain-containing protein [unclassified Rathayibacter]PPG51442.1 hypothetical protein C5C24_07220 [Rathayibacter sp. AY2B3]PPI23850.1 hypothetical protein C5D44_12705 [Rathayibacter sp. AY1B5]
MNDWQINGLPLHPLLVHAVVVLLPLAALMLVLGSVWPAARRRFGIFTPIIALAALIAVPLTTQAGEALERRTEPSAILELHTELGDHLLPWAAGLFLIALVQWLWFRRTRRSDDHATTRRPVVGIVLAVAAIAVSVGATIDVVRIGDSGAQAVWSDSTTGTDQAPAPSGDSDD